MKNLSFEQFDSAVQTYADKTMKLISKNVAARVFEEVAKGIIESTPLLTGQARRNWKATLDSPSEDVDIDPQYYEHWKQAEAAGGVHGGSPITAEEMAQIQSVTKEFEKGDHDILYLTNNLVYIWFLDQGSSKAAPGGMVLPSIQATLQALKDGAIKL